MRRFGFGFVVAGLLAASAAGQDAVEIKIAYPKAGQKAKVTVEEKATTKTTFTVGGNTQSKDEVKTKSLVYVDDVIENPKNEKRPDKVRRTYEKAVVGADGNTKKLPVEGKTVLIEKTGDKYAFTVDGQPVTGEALKLLEDEFNKSKEKDPTDDLVKAVGEGGLKLDKDKLMATGKLVKVYKKEGRQFGVIEFAVDGPITGLGEKAPVTVKEGKMTMKLTGDGCIDGSAPAGTSSSAMTFDITGTTQGIDLKVTVEMTEKRTTEEVKK